MWRVFGTYYHGSLLFEAHEIPHLVSIDSIDTPQRAFVMEVKDCHFCIQNIVQIPLERAARLALTQTLSSIGASGRFACCVTVMKSGSGPPPSR